MVFWEFRVVFGAFYKESFPNLHRHQKKQKNKPLHAPNLHRHQKNKQTKPQQLVWKHGHRFGIFVFFVFWCLRRFGDDCTLVCLVFWCLCRFGELSHSKHTVFAVFCEPHHIINIKNLLFTWASEHPSAKNIAIYSVVFVNLKVGGGRDNTRGDLVLPTCYAYAFYIKIKIYTFKIYLQKMQDERLKQCVCLLASLGLIINGFFFFR